MRALSTRVVVVNVTLVQLGISFLLYFLNNLDWCHQKFHESEFPQEIWSTIKYTSKLKKTQTIYWKIRPHMHTYFKIARRLIDIFQYNAKSPTKSIFFPQNQQPIDTSANLSRD